MAKSRKRGRTGWEPAPFADEPKDVVVDGVALHVHGRYAPLFSCGIAVSPDNAHLAFGFASDPFGGRLGDDHARVLDLTTYREVFGVSMGPARGFQFCRTRPWLAAADHHGRIHVAEIPGG